MSMQPLSTCNPEPCWSHDRRYRYELRRLRIPNEAREQRGTVNFILLNPSTADRVQSDPTVHSCEWLASQWGFANLIVTNLFSMVATDPTQLREAADPVGPLTNQFLMAAAREADSRVAAWGGTGKHACHLKDRSLWLRMALHRDGLELKCLRLNPDSTPLHPSPQALHGPNRRECLTFESLESYSLSEELQDVLRGVGRVGVEARRVDVESPTDRRVVIERLKARRALRPSVPLDELLRARDEGRKLGWRLS